MACRGIKLPNGGAAIVCGPRKRRRNCDRCGAKATLLCDWKTDAGKTCDRPICTACAEEVGPDKHLCPDHQLAWAEWQRQRGSRFEPVPVRPGNDSPSGSRG